MRIARRHSSASRALAAALVLPVPAASEEVVFTKLADEDTAIRAHGDRPALHDGKVALLGRDQATQIAGIYWTLADGSGPFVLVADELTPIPNAPGEVFELLRNPAIFDGVVAFAGGHQVDINEGVYLGDGGELEVLVDRSAGDPTPAHPSFDAAGVSYEIDPSVFEQPVFQPRDGSGPFLVAASGAPAPGGGIFATFDLNSTPALGGGLVAFAALVTAPGVAGVYTYDTANGALDWIANGMTPMPGHLVSFEFFSAADTDGQSVAFAGMHGLPCCGGELGVYLAPAASSGQGPFTVIAEGNQAVPGVPGAVFDSFGNVAVDGDLVVFEGFWALEGDPGMGLYAWRRGRLFPIVDTTDVLAAEDLLGFSLTHRSVDGDQIVFRAVFDDPTAPFGQGLALWVATLAGTLFGDGFESGDTSAWSLTVP
jgi:hypothetical protein